MYKEADMRIRDCLEAVGIAVLFYIVMDILGVWNIWF